LKKSTQKLLSLLSERAALLKDEEISFLIEQAEVLITNAEIEEMQKNERSFSSEIQVKPVDDSLVKIEFSQGTKSANIIINGAHKFFTKEELGILVRICLSESETIKKKQLLYTWFNKERRDVLLDSGISAPQSRILDAFIESTQKFFQK